MPRAPDPLDVLKLDRERLLAFAVKTSPARMRALLAKAQADLDRRLKERVKVVGPKDEAFSTAQLRVALAQVREALDVLRPAMKGQILENGKEAASKSVDGTLRYFEAAERKYRGIVRPLPFDTAAMHDRVTRGAESSLLKRIESDPSHRGHRGVLDRYGDAVIQSFEEQLQLRLLTRKPWDETRKALVASSPFLQGAPAHWAERIARTEAMFASNASSQQSIEIAAETFDDACKILSATFDGRTAADSYAVHGQIRRPNEPFDTWQGPVMHPPARPNDRETVVPHRLSWPIPAQLRPKSDGQVAARWAQEGRKGSPPPRPRLSTIPERQLKRSA